MHFRSFTSTQVISGLSKETWFNIRSLCDFSSQVSLRLVHRLFYRDTQTLFREKLSSYDSFLRPSRVFSLIPRLKSSEEGGLYLFRAFLDVCSNSIISTLLSDPEERGFSIECIGVIFDLAMNARGTLRYTRIIQMCEEISETLRGAVGGGLRLVPSAFGRTGEFSSDKVSDRDVSFLCTLRLIMDRTLYLVGSEEARKLFNPNILTVLSEKNSQFAVNHPKLVSAEGRYLCIEMLFTVDDYRNY